MKLKLNLYSLGAFHLVRTQFDMLSGPTHPLFACNTEWKCIGGLTPPTHPRCVRTKWKAPCLIQDYFLQRLENLENKNGHGKVMEHETLAKRHGILLSVMDFYQFCPQLEPNLFIHHHGSLDLLTFSAKRRNCKIKKIDYHGKLRNCHGKVKEKSWKNILSVRTLLIVLNETTNILI